MRSVQRNSVLLAGGGLLAFGASSVRAAPLTSMSGKFEGTRPDSIDGVVSVDDYRPANGQAFLVGGSGIRGTVGSGTVFMANDLTHLDIAFVPGANHNDVAVLYLKTRSGGFDDAALSGEQDSGGRADFAVAFGPAVIALYELNGSMTDGSLVFIATTSAAAGAGDTTPREIRIPLADLGTMPGATIEFFMAYESKTGILSNESMPASAPPGRTPAAIPTRARPTWSSARRTPRRSISRCWARAASASTASTPSMLQVPAFPERATSTATVSPT